MILLSYLTFRAVIISYTEDGVRYVSFSLFDPCGKLRWYRQNRYNMAMRSSYFLIQHWSETRRKKTQDITLSIYKQIFSLFSIEIHRSFFFLPSRYSVYDRRRRGEEEEDEEEKKELFLFLLSFGLCAYNRWRTWPTHTNTTSSRFTSTNFFCIKSILIVIFKETKTEWVFLLVIAV
jgi:hypothetical protein